MSLIQCDESVCAQVVRVKKTPKHRSIIKIKMAVYEEAKNKR